MRYSPVSPCRPVDQRVTAGLPDARCRTVVPGTGRHREGYANGTSGTVSDGPRLFPLAGRSSPVAPRVTVRHSRCSGEEAAGASPAGAGSTKGGDRDTATGRAYSD